MTRSNWTQLRLDFDPADMQDGRSLSGAEAWLRLRAGAGPEMFGFEVWWGAWFVRNNVIPDLAALNKVELLSWDQCGLMGPCLAVGRGPADALVDELASAKWPDWRRLYEGDPRLQAPLDDATLV